MMRFESISREGTAYEVIKSDSFRDIGFNRSPGAFLVPEFREYLTYGDGMIQHSPASPVNSDFFVDALASLATYLQDNPENVETVASWWPSTNQFEKIPFAMTIKYNPEKPQYFSLDMEKVSRSEKLRYDNRYESVPPWADGKLEATFRFACRSWYGVIHRFALYEVIRKAYGYEYSMEGSGFGSMEDYRYLCDSFRAVDALVQVFWAQEWARRVFTTLQHNWIDKQNGQNVAVAAVA